jgi:hypothetical protein
MSNPENLVEKAPSTVNVSGGNLAGAKAIDTDLSGTDLTGATVGDRSRLDSAGHGRSPDPDGISEHQHRFDDVEPKTDAATTYHGLDNPA